MAIIAVLVAIAVPLFVGALNDAQERVKDANIRAVRGAAVVEILSAKPSKAAAASATDDIYSLKTEGTTYSWELKGPWYATATINKNGDIQKIVVNLTTATEKYEEKDGVITCIVTINKTDLTATAGSAGGV